MSVEITIPTGEFLNALQIAHLTAAKEKDNILSNAIVEVANGKVNVESRNNILFSRRSMETPINKNAGFVTEPGRLLTIFRELKEPETTLSIDENTVTIKNGRYKTTIKTLDKDSYPRYEEEEKRLLCKVDFDTIRQMLKITSAYPDKNDISREYTGVFLEIGDGKLMATATDHFRLINVVTLLESEESGGFILENAMANLIPRINMDNQVELYVGEGSFEVRNSKGSVSSRLISGEFPNYRAILLGENDNMIEVNRADMLSCIRRVSVISAESGIDVDINPQDGKVMFISTNKEGETSEDTVDILNSNNSNQVRMKLNYKFLVNFLNQMNTETISFLYRSSEEPIMLKAEDDRFTYNHVMTPIME